MLEIRNHRSRRRTAGFSVVEILIVLAILGILAVAVIPSITGWLKKLRLEGAIKNASGMVMQARARAVRAGVPVVIVTEPSTNHQRAGDYLRAYEVEDYWTKPASLTFGIAKDPVWELPLPWSGRQTSTVHFWTVTEVNPDAGSYLVDFTTNNDANTNATYPTVIVFDPDGTVRDPGKLRFGMGEAGGAVNHLEIEFTKAGNLKIKKYIASQGDYDIKRQLPAGKGINWVWY